MMVSLWLVAHLGGATRKLGTCSFLRRAKVWGVLKFSSSAVFVPTARHFSLCKREIERDLPWLCLDDNRNPVNPSFEKREVACIDHDVP